MPYVISRYYTWHVMCTNNEFQTLNLVDLRIWLKLHTNEMEDNYLHNATRLHKDLLRACIF